METTDAPEAPTASVAAAAYGHACANCARAKCRCILRPGGGTTCERCHRLGKQCIPSTAVRKSAYRARDPAAKAPASNRRVRELEEKLNELTSVVRSVQQSQQKEQHQTDAPSAGSSQGMITTPTHSQSITSGQSPSSPSVDTTGIAMGYSVTEELSAQEARQYLDIFRDRHLSFFPLVYLSPDVTPEQLQRDRPFLWLCIRAICTKSVEKQLALGAYIREIMARKVIVDGERSIDLLVGLSAFLAWLVPLVYQFSYVIIF